MLKRLTTILSPRFIFPLGGNRSGQQRTRDFPQSAELIFSRLNIERSLLKIEATTHFYEVISYMYVVLHLCFYFRWSEGVRGQEVNRDVDILIVLISILSILS